MLLPSFEFCAAKTVQEATTLWAEVPNTRYLAGGTDLLPQARFRKNVARVIDVKGIPELKLVRETADDVAIGAAVDMNTVAGHKLVKDRFPVLVQCIEEVGAWPLRNRATLGGNVCNASPAADTAPALLALDAKVVVAGAKGTYTVALADFFQGPGKSALKPGELLLEILLPKKAAGFAGRYLRLSRRRGMDLATVGVLVARGENRQHRVALCAVSPRPMRVSEAEQVLGDGLSESTIQKASELAVAACSPITDVRGTAAYRREMVGVLTARGLTALA